MSLNVILGRDPYATFAGYVFQVNVTILRWLELGPEARLELEAAEDIDTVQSSSGGGEEEAARLVEQLKQVSRSITLRTPDALEAIANFCELRRLNPGANLSFRFLTTASVGREQTPWEDKFPAITVWQKLRNSQYSDADRISSIERLRSFLLQCQNGGKISAGSWDALQTVLAEPTLESFEAVVSSFEWATESGNHEEMEEFVCLALQARDPEGSLGRAKLHYRNLFCYVLKLLTQKGAKQLTSALLASELTATSATLEDQLSAVRLRRWIDRIDAKLAEHDDQIADHATRIEVLESRPVRGGANTFKAPEAVRAETGFLFDYDQTLRGRQRRLDQLTGFLNDSTKRIALLPGRGGIGKTKLLRDWSENADNWHKLWVNPYGSWAIDSPAEMPAGPTLLIVDDAHRYDDLNQLISYVAQADSTRQLKLVIATRPSGTAFVDEALAREADESFVSRFDELKQLGPEATLEIAREMLGSRKEHLAEALARVSADTPLVTVVGGRLIARGEILPDLLGNDEAFRKAVFSKFADECEGNLPVGGRSRREVLQLIAAVQPVIEQDEQFADRAAVFLALRPDQLWQGLDDLERRGILVRGRGGARIAPDLFGDYLLETASVGNHGVPTGFAEAIFEQFEESHLSNLLKNFAELDWRITQRDPESQLLDNIWSSIYTRFRSQNAPSRERFLREVKTIAVFQPARVEELVRIAMTDEATPGRDWGFQRLKTQEDVLEELPPLLGVTIYHETVSRDAFNRLWELSRHNSSSIHGPARKALKEATGYHKYKNVIYNERMLTLTEDRARDDGAYDGDFTPLSLMEELLDREVEDTGFRKRTFSITFNPVNYPIIRPLRERALQAVQRALQSPSPRIAVKAVDAISGVLSVFRPTLRNDPSETERLWQEAERFHALDMVESRINTGNLSLPLVWRLNRSLKGVARGDRQSASVRERAEAIRSTIPLPELFELFEVICTNEYEDGVTELGHISIPQARRDQEQRAYARLREDYPEPDAQISALRELLAQIDDAEIRPQSFGNVFVVLCRDRRFLERVTEHIREGQPTVLLSWANVPLLQWRDVDLSEYLRYGRLFAASPNWRMVRIVSACVAATATENGALSEDIALLLLVAGRTEGAILGDVLFALKRLARSHSYSLVALVLFARIKVGNDEHLANEYCNAVGAYGIPADLFDAETVEAVMGNLIEIDELDSHAIGSLMAHLSGIAPLAMVRFFENRLMRHKSLTEGDTVTDYKPVPYSDSWSTLGAARESPEYGAAIGAFIDLLRRFPDYDLYLAPILRHMATLDETTLSALDGLLHEDGDAGATLATQILRKGPRGIALSQFTFTMHLLEICSEKGEELEQQARTVLFTNVVYGSGGQVYAGPVPPPPDLSHMSRAAVLRDQCVAGSPAHRFYADLANAEPAAISSQLFDQFDDDEDDSVKTESAIDAAERA
jgi:hypothetical protein